MGQTRGTRRRTWPTSTGRIRDGSSRPGQSTTGPRGAPKGACQQDTPRQHEGRLGRCWPALPSGCARTRGYGGGGVTSSDRLTQLWAPAVCLPGDQRAGGPGRCCRCRRGQRGAATPSPLRRRGTGCGRPGEGGRAALGKAHALKPNVHLSKNVPRPRGRWARLAKPTQKSDPHTVPGRLANPINVTAWSGCSARAATKRKDRDRRHR